MKTYIYTLEHPITREIRYVGKTTNIKRRYSQHISIPIAKKLTNAHLKNWLLLMLENELKPILQVLEECENNWQECEMYWIEQFKQWGFKLVNYTRGGEGFGYKHTESSRKKMSLAQKGTSRNFSKETLEAKKKNFTNNNPLFDEKIKEKWKISNLNHLKNLNNSEEFKKIRRAIYYKKLEEGYHPSHKKVINTETKEIFNSAKECAIFLGICPYKFRRYLRGDIKNKTKFEYYEKYN